MTVTHDVSRRNGPTIVAHRGYPSRYPENTWRGIQAALACGARWLEVDVQLTAEQTPILYHDPDTHRVSGVSRIVMETSLAELQRHGAFHPQRFGARFRGTPITTLRQLCRCLDQHPEVRAFIELKPESAGYFGAAQMVERVGHELHRLARTTSVAAVISKEARLLPLVRAAGLWPVGWVLPGTTAAVARQVARLTPELLFCDYRRLPAVHEPPWQGSWEWAVYTVNQPEAAHRFAELGARFLETDCVGEFR